MLTNWLPTKNNLNRISKGTIYDILIIDDSPNEAATNAGYKTLILNPSIIQKGLEKRRYWRYRGTNPMKEIAKVAKLKVGFDYFLQNTNLPWLKYQDGDTYLIFDNYQLMMKDYTDKYPYPKVFNEPIIKGCCTSDRFEYYFQGGTGLLMSRKAVEKFVEKWDKFFYSFNNFEDRSVTKLIASSGISLADLSSTYFLGDIVKPSFVDFIRNGNFTNLQRCPSQHPPTQCANEYYVLNKVASVHKVDDYDPSIEKLIKSGKLPDNVRFYHNSWNPSLCYMEN